MNRSFIHKLLPAPVSGGFEMENYWVWCGSVIQGEDGKYHMFASRWPKSLTFKPHWLTNSEIVRAVSDTAEGPYTFQEVVLPARGNSYWDGMMTHNPTIHKSGDTYLLYYTGTTYEGERPDPLHQVPMGSPRIQEVRQNQRIGLATSRSIYGPWKRMDQPILQTRPGCWDSTMTTNAAPCVLADGRVLLIYKSSSGEGAKLRLGAAMAESYNVPYERLKDEPIFDFTATGDHVEDPYVWHNGNNFELIMKDMHGGICGEKFGGVHAVSEDGIHWDVSQQPLAYSRTVRWDDGTITLQGHVERPQLLIRDGKPTHFFAATANGASVFDKRNPSTRTWTMAIPLSAEGE